MACRGSDSASYCIFAFELAKPDSLWRRCRARIALFSSVDQLIKDAMEFGPIYGIAGVLKSEHHGAAHATLRLSAVARDFVVAIR